MAVEDVIEGEMKSYATPMERAAYRAGMSTAAMICDSVAKDTRLANPGRRKGTASAVGEFAAEIAERCGDKIMRARERVMTDN